MSVADLASVSDASQPPHILLVDDDDHILQGYRRVLEAAGYQVTVASNGQMALDLLDRLFFDTVLSDISMPELGGVELLKAIRGRDLDVPVVLMTATPHLSTAMEAVSYGAAAYVAKPFERQALLETLSRTVRLHRLARLKREAVALSGDDSLQFGDRASLEGAFQRAMDGLWMAYQPIVSLSSRQVLAYEALLRTDAVFSNPGAFLSAASRLDKLHELGRLTRARIARQLPELPASLVFVNLHAHDLLDEELYSRRAPLSTYASRVVLEVTERASLEEIKGCERRVSDLRRLGYRLAVDDLGAGYAGLNSFVQIDPEVVKFDMSLVRDIDTSAVKQRLVESMTELFRQMGKLVVAEGVETTAERDALGDRGCDLLQGYLFARPARVYPTPRW